MFRSPPARLVLVCLIALVGLIPGSAAFASVRLEDAGNVPFYARIVSATDWTAIIFYRPPQCVPDDFDLLTFFDIPGAFSCGPATTDGFAIWRNGPDVDFAPLQINLEGLGAVPIYFVKTAEFEAAAEGGLTVGELEALPSLVVGTASRYHEILHPTEGARVGKLTVVATGTLSDGRAFRFQATSTKGNDKVQIVFD